MDVRRIRPLVPPPYPRRNRYTPMSPEETMLPPHLPQALDLPEMLRIASLPLLSTSPPLCWAPMLVKTLGFTCKLRFSASNLLRCRLRCWQVQGH